MLRKVRRFVRRRTDTWWGVSIDIDGCIIWLSFFQNKMPELLRKSGIPPLLSSTGHNVELILHTEVPSVFSAFKMAGYTPSQVSFVVK